MNNEWEKRFDEIFMREDGLLDVGKYDDESLKSFITALLASERADWLRSEIEKLEVTRKELWLDYHNAQKWSEQKAVAETLDSIITRYKEELKVLESKHDDWNEDMERNEELMNDSKEELLELEKGV